MSSEPPVSISHQLYVATTHKPSAVSCVAIAALIDANAKNLVVARGNIIDIYSHSLSGALIIEDSLTLSGRISCMDTIRLPKAQTDSIFVLTDKKHFVLLGWDNKIGKIAPLSTGNMKIRNHFLSLVGSKLFIDRNHSLIGAYVQDGCIKIIPVESYGLKEAIDLRLDILKPIDIQFLYGQDLPTMCVLYEDERQVKYFRTYTVDPKDKELGNTVQASWSQKGLDIGAKFVIPLPAPLFGVLIVGESTITYYNNMMQDATQSVAISGICSGITAYTFLDPSGLRLLVSDDNGKMFVLVLVTRKLVNTTELVRLSIDPIIDEANVAAIAHSIEYLGEGVIFIGSCYGDSQLARLSSENSGQQIEILQTFPNIGPIVDMVVVEGEKQGQNYIVTCSGGFGAGSLRVIRSGIGVDEQAFVELEGLKSVWSLKGQDLGYDKYLVQSYIGETRLLAIESDEMGEVDDAGAFLVGEETLFCSNMGNLFVLQVTHNSILLMNSADFSQVCLINNFSSQIVLATANRTQVVVAFSGGGLVCYELDSSSQTLIEKARTTFEFDIACMSLDMTPDGSEVDKSVSSSASFEADFMDNSDEGGSRSFKSNILAISLWTENMVILMKLPSDDSPNKFITISKAQVQSDSQVRSVMFVQLGHSKYCLVGMGDGVLFSYLVDSSGLLQGRKKYLLGSRPISLTFFRNNGEPCVFVSSDRPTIIYCGNDKLLFSGVNTAETLSMTPFNSEMFSNSFCLCTDQGLLIGSIDSIQKLYIKTVALGGLSDGQDGEHSRDPSSSSPVTTDRARRRCSPRRICYHSTSGTFAVIVEEFDINNYSSFYVYFYDEAKLDFISKTELDVGEEGVSCASCFINCNSGVGNEDLMEYIAIGTTYQSYESSNSEPSKGRILVYHISVDPIANKKDVALVADIETKGTVFSLAVVSGNLVAAINNEVSVFLCTHSNPSSHDLHFSTGQGLTYKGNILACYIKAHSNYVLVGDIVRSMTLLVFKVEEKKLLECARDFNANYMKAVEILGDDNNFFLGADDNGNLFTLKRKDAGSSESAKLDVAGEFHLGDFVNVIRRGSLVSHQGDQEISSTSSIANSIVLSPVTNTPIQSNAYLFGTISGTIGTALILDDSKFKFFSSLERAVKSVLVTRSSCLDHSEWRKFVNERRSSAHKKIVDGDMVSRFLDLSKEDQRDAVKKMNEDYYAVAQPMNTASTNSSITSSFGLTSVLSSDCAQFGIDEVISRVEDISRLH